MEKVVITGGAGFIGSHLASFLSGSGFRVTVLDNLSTGHRRNLVGLDVELVEGDVRDDALVRRVVTRARWVLHHAAVVSVPQSVSNPTETHEVNGTGTLVVLSAARAAGVERVTFAASAAAYGRSESLPKRESDEPDPVSPYAATKLLGEHYAAVFTAQYGLPCFPLRYFNIYGERQDPAGPYAAVISRFADRMRAGQAPTILGDGLQTRDFCHVSDVVQANWRALHAPAESAGRPINIGTGASTSLLDLVDAFNAVLGTSLVPEHGPVRAGDVRHSMADIGRARALLDYAPTVPLREGLRRLVASLDPLPAERNGT